MLIPTGILCSLLPWQASAPVQAPSGSIPRISEQEAAPPKLDGRLDEAFWSQCLVLGDFRQAEPVAGRVPSEATEILLAYDERNLYIGLRCWDKKPEEIRATQMARDANLDPDDRVELILDTFNDSRNGFWFQLGAAGSRGDALISRNGSNFNKRWDTIWFGDSKVTSEGWFGEIRIPFASINFDPETTQWGFNARRFIRTRNEEARWAAPDPRFRFFDPARAGKLTGFRDLKQGIGLDVVPFFVGTYSNLDQESEHWLGDAGLDAFYKLSPSTKLSLSFNTDFAETEVDQRRVNLSRFALFFPEKRKFFLEDSGVFNFGPGGFGGRAGNNPIPFFSRRIGLEEDGNEVPLLGNVKLTSATDSYSFGLLHSQTEEVQGVGARSLSVARFSKNILDQSNAGVIFTHGNPTGPSDRFTAGADINLRTDRFLGDRRLNFSSYVLGTQAESNNTENLAYAASVEYPNDQVQASASYITIEKNFDPTLGFVRRRGIRQYESELAYRPRMGNFIRRLQFSFNPRWITNTSGDTQTRLLRFTPFGIDFESDDQFRLTVTPTREVLDEDFAIQDPVTIPEGTYDFVRVSASLETSDKRDVSTELRFTTGSFFDGNRSDYSVDFDWRASKHAIVGIEYDLNDVDLANGSFDVNIANMRLDLLLSPWTSWSNFVQWDDVSDNLGLNSRLRIIFEPGQDLFVVLNQGWTTFDDGFAPTSTDIRFKLSYTFRF